MARDDLQESKPTPGMAGFRTFTHAEPAPTGLRESLHSREGQRLFDSFRALGLSEAGALRAVTGRDGPLRVAAPPRVSGHGAPGGAVAFVEAERLVRARVAEASSLPVATRARVAAQVLAGVPKSGQVDAKALIETADRMLQVELREAAKIVSGRAGSATGGAAPRVPASTPSGAIGSPARPFTEARRAAKAERAAAEADLAESFEALGLSPESARRAARGRR